jgi:hypothetical protein
MTCSGTALVGATRSRTGQHRAGRYGTRQYGTRQYGAVPPRTPQYRTGPYTYPERSDRPDHRHLHRDPNRHPNPAHGRSPRHGDAE